jgi:cytochrome P450
VFKYEIVKSILCDSDVFSTKNYQKMDNILLGSDGDIHNRNKKEIYLGIEMLHANFYEDDIINEVIDLLFSQILELKNSKINLVYNLINPFVFLVVLKKMGMSKILQKLNLYDLKQDFKETIILINDFFDNPELLNEIILRSYEEDEISDDFKRLLNLFNDKYQINRDELIKLTKFFVLAGIETTASLISSCLFNMYNGKNSFTKPITTEIIESIINETLRLYSPAQFTFRTTQIDTEINNNFIPKDSLIAISIGAANRDPLRFNQPDSFILNRDEKHISFGISSHRCIGDKLALFITKRFIEKFLQYEKNIKFHDEYKTKNTNIEFKINEIIISII